MEEPEFPKDFILKPGYFKNQYLNPRGNSSDFTGPAPTFLPVEPYKIIDGMPCQILGLLIESGVMDISNPPSDFDFGESTDEEEEDDDVVEVPMEKPSAEIINLEEEEEYISEEGEIIISNSPSENATIQPVVEKAKEDTNPKLGSSKNPKVKETSSVKLKRKEESCSVRNSKVRRDNSCSSDEELAPKEKHKKKKSKKHDSYSDDSYSDDSRYSSKNKKSSRRRKRTISNYSDSESDREEIKHPKTEVKKEPDVFLYGDYYCEVCCVSVNSEGTLRSHMNGKRHMKELNKKDSAKAVADSVKIANLPSRYPLPPPGIIRVPLLNEIARTQQEVDENVKIPCPGLNKVIAIEGIYEDTFYCELCDAPCATNSIIPHLIGHKHRLNCLKYFEPEIYEKYQYCKKTEVDKRISSILAEIERKFGRGKMTLEREARSEKKEARAQFESMIDRRYRREPVPGPSSSRPAAPEVYEKAAIPDRAQPDYYCPTCDSHMNSINMWEAHINGRRHLTNMKKPVGERPSKVKSVPVSARPKLSSLLRGIYAPVVGLKHMRETQNPEASGPTYNCFLCGACMTEIDVVEHILSLKHRTKYLENIHHEDLILLRQMAMQPDNMSSIIERTCADVEREIGRGEIEVHIMRNAVRKW